MTNDTSVSFLRFFTRNLLTRNLAAFVAVVAMSAVPQALLAQDQAGLPGPDSVIATVDGDTITEADLAFAAEDLAQELSNVPAAERRSFLASVLIDMKVMAKAARAENMQDSEVFRRRQRYLEDRALRRAYFAEKIGSQVTLEAIQELYQDLIADFKPQEEIRARHILVAEEDDANTIRAEIEAGKPFEIAASENSIDGSAQNGGDLGYFVRGQMVPPFEQAAFALEVGQVSAPVQSQFGWHLIKLEDRRQSAPPPLEQISAQLQQQVLIKAFDAAISELKAGAAITISDPEIAAAIAQDDAGTQN